MTDPGLFKERHMSEIPFLYIWPAYTQLAFFNGRGKTLGEWANRRLDLSDTLMVNPSRSRKSRRIGIAVATRAKGWVVWDEAHLQAIEEHIRYDLGFEDFGVRIRRLTPQGETPQPCSEPFRWWLEIWGRRSWLVSFEDVCDDDR